MKKTKTIFGVILFASVILTSCGGSIESDAKKIAEYNSEIENIKENSELDEISKVDEPEKIVPANVSCKLFFEVDDFTDEETGETSKGTVSEREEFKTEKAYTFCYDSESFHHLTLIGTGDNLSFIINVGNEQVFKKESFDLKGEFTFSTKDFSFGMGEIYMIVIKQNETIIFNGKIDSQGCM